MGIFSFVKPGKQIFKTITSVKPNVPVTKGQKLKRDLKIATQKSKAAGAKLDNTRFRIEQQKKRLEKGRVYSGKELEQQKYFKDMNKRREKKMGGGMMGRRMGYSQGSSKGKIPTTPKEKSLAKLAPPRDRITFGDVVAGRTKGKRMQASVGGGADSGRIGQLKSDLKLAKNLTEKRAALQKADKDRNKFNKKSK